MKVFKLIPIKEHINDVEWEHCVNIPKYCIVLAENEDKAMKIAQDYNLIAIESGKVHRFPLLCKKLIKIEDLSETDPSAAKKYLTKLENSAERCINSKEGFRRQDVLSSS